MRRNDEQWWSEPRVEGKPLVLCFVYSVVANFGVHGFDKTGGREEWILGQFQF